MNKIADLDKTYIKLENVRKNKNSHCFLLLRDITIFIPTHMWRLAYSHSGHSSGNHTRSTRPTGIYVSCSSLLSNQLSAVYMAWLTDNSCRRKCFAISWSWHTAIITANDLYAHSSYSILKNKNFRTWITWFMKSFVSSVSKYSVYLRVFMCVCP